MSDEQIPRDNLEELNRELRARHDRLYTILEKSEEATLKSAENSIRVLLFMNSGATVSVLAFAGSLASKDRVTTDQLNAIAGSLVWFAYGIATSALTSFFFYLTNLFYLFANASHSRQLVFPHVVPTPQSVRRHLIGRIFHVLAVLAAIASLFLFLIGMYEVKEAIKHLG